MRIQGKHIDGKPEADWPAMKREIAKHERFVIEVTEYDDRMEISEQQNKWLHCDGGPIMYYVSKGWEFEEAKRFLKVKYGRKIFVREMTDKNCTKAKGAFFWECQIASCNKLIYPWQIMYSSVTSQRVCPHCLQSKVMPIILKSINQVAVSRIKAWFDTIINAEDGLFPPNPELKKGNQNASTNQ